MQLRLRFKPNIEFEEYEAKVFFTIALCFIASLTIIMVLDILYTLDEHVLKVYSMAVNTSMALIIAYQSRYTRKSVIQSMKSQAWQIVSGSLSIITLLHLS